MNYSPLTFTDSRAKNERAATKNYIDNFIKTNNLREYKYHEHDLTYYFDGTRYYINDKNEVYRMHLSGIDPGPHKKRTPLI